VTLGTAQEITVQNHRTNLRRSQIKRPTTFCTTPGINNTMSTNSGESNTKWSQSATIYPPFEEIIKSLQDPGKSVTVKKGGGREYSSHKYPLMEKLATKVFTAIQRNLNPEGLTKNVSRGKIPLFKEMLLSRKHVDISETHSAFHPYGKDGKVFLIGNDPIHAGLSFAVDRFQEYIQVQLEQKNSARTFNDGIRLGCIMLDPKYHSSMAGVVSKKRKGRTKGDIPGDTNTNFFQEILTECFLNPEYQVQPPNSVYFDEFPEDDKAGWDPNHPSIFEHDRNGEWLRATWDDYIKPRYKKALDKWNKDTGGGDGGPVKFIDFCERDRWLVWIFCKDLEANFLLANSAGGRMPAHLQVESGFNDEVSCITGSDGSTPPSKVAKELEDELLSSMRQHKAKLTDTMERVVDYLDAKQRREQDTQTSMDGYIRQVADYSQMMKDSSVLETMSPESKELYVTTIKQQRKSVLEKMKTESSNKDK
jgi:hypothetical protein